MHDEEEASQLGDTVEIVEARPYSKTKRWELVRVVTKSQAVDLAALRAASKAVESEPGEGPDASSSPAAEPRGPAEGA